METDKGGENVTKETYMEKEKKDTSEMAQILNRVPENKKESVLMLVTGYVLASEEQKLRTG